MDFIESANKTVNSFLDTNVYGSPIVSSVLSLFLVLYAGLAAPKLPKKIAKLFGNQVFRIVILICIAYMASKDASLSIISAIALVVSLQTLSYHEANEVVAETIADEAAHLEVDDHDDHDDHDHEEDHEEDQVEPTVEDSDIASQSVEESVPEPIFDETEEDTNEDKKIEDLPLFKPSNGLLSNQVDVNASFLGNEEILDNQMEEPEEPIVEAPNAAPVFDESEEDYEVSGKIEDEYEETEEQDDHDEIQESPEENLPDGDNTKETKFAGYKHKHDGVESNSENIKKNTNRIKELEKILRPTKTHVEENVHDNDSVLENKDYTVLPFGGDAYAEF